MYSEILFYALSRQLLFELPTFPHASALSFLTTLPSFASFSLDIRLIYNRLIFVIDRLIHMLYTAGLAYGNNLNIHTSHFPIIYWPECAFLLFIDSVNYRFILRMRHMVIWYVVWGYTIQTSTVLLVLTNCWSVFLLSSTIYNSCFQIIWVAWIFCYFRDKPTNRIYF